VFVLTDGEVNNTDKVVQLVAEHHHKANDNSRLFSIGIGRNASRALVNGISRAGRGISEFVESNERLEKKVTALLKASLQPALTNLSIDFLDDENRSVAQAKEQAPHQLPPVYSDSRLTFYNVLSSTGNNTAIPVKCLRITAMSPDGPLSLQLPLQSKTVTAESKVRLLPVSSSGLWFLNLFLQLGKSFIHTLAARAIIRDLEEVCN